MTTTPNQTTREEISGEMREKADQVAAALRNLHGLPVIATESDTQPGRSALWMDNGMAGAGQVAISTGEFPCAQTTALATLVNVAASFDFDALIAALQSPTGDRLEWRPIESAPKDGTEILICGGTYTSDLSEGGPFHFPGVTFARWANVWGQEGWQGEPQAHDEYLWHKPELWTLAPAPPAHLSRSIVGEGE